MEKTSMEEKKSGICIYPGSFDPITNGHMNLIERALHIFERVIVAVANNPDKNNLFSVEEKKEMIQIALGGNPKVEIDSFDGLLVDYAKLKGVHVVLRGLRAMSDFEYEFQMTFMNRKLDRTIDTIFMMTGLRWFYVNSKMIKSAAKAGADVCGLVPDIVCKRLAEKLMVKI
jgi:pantetheine-phosphate adenylyltransferase